MLKFINFCGHLRNYSIKHVPKKPVKYTDTINLPKTKFPNHLTHAKREEIEQHLLDRAFKTAYSYQLNEKKEPTFILHDGPPYANGELHMGHAVNKILKDITLRYHGSEGQKIEYIPGWDCHGLPIELKAMASSKTKDSEEIKDALFVRKKSRQFASEAIEKQKQDFRSWGILTDWYNEKNIYKTFNPEFITNQLRLFSKFYESELVYRDLKPVYWSPSSRTALAEAELEYDENFTSPSVYVRFLLTQLPLGVSSNAKVYAIVWTTTPWTLPSNQAICFNAALEYSFVELPEQASGNDELYLLATNLLEDFQEKTKLKFSIKHRIKGDDLQFCTYRHPIFKEQQALPFFDGRHVQDTKGTGLVHTAPAHGPDDFLIGLKEKLPLKSFVNEDGIYSLEAPDFLRGKVVLDAGNTLVLERITQDVLFATSFTHSYPIDWRTKKPVIIRASEQWFMNTEKLKAKAVAALNAVKIYPHVNSEANRKALITQVLKRPYWCISRQRVWGVPIPVFYKKLSNVVVTSHDIIEHLCNLVEAEGNIDFWWRKSVHEILPSSLLKPFKVTPDQLEKGADIFDIWFDSGSTWSSVLGNDKIADLYLEGHDQFTGWFQSSLLTSIAARDCAPYKSIFVHGFTVDEKGHKMSKSLGNVISPKDITKKYGVDILRWWVASHGTQHASIVVSDKLLQQASENINKIRSTLRYLNGVIGVKTTGYQPTTSADQIYLNKYLLSALVNFEKEIQQHYKNFEYNRAVAVIQNFVANDISAIYVNSIKDRLYCGDDLDLQNICYTLSQCYEILCKVLWPITPFLVEESWSYYDLDSQGFHTQNITTNSEWLNNEAEEVIQAAFDLKRVINQNALGVNSWGLDVDVICFSQIKLNQLKLLQGELNQSLNNSELCELLQVASVTLTPTNVRIDDDFLVKVTPIKIQLCPRCRRFAVKDDAHSTCSRCTEVLEGKSLFL